MLRPDVVVAHRKRFARRPREALRGPWRVRPRRGRTISRNGWNGCCYAPAHGLTGDAMVIQNLTRDIVLGLEESEEQVFGPDVVVAEPDRFLSGGEQRRLGTSGQEFGRWFR